MKEKILSESNRKICLEAEGKYHFIDAINGAACYIESDVFDKIIKKSNPEAVSKVPDLEKGKYPFTDESTGEVYYIDPRLLEGKGRVALSEPCVANDNANVSRKATIEDDFDIGIVISKAIFEKKSNGEVVSNAPCKKYKGEYVFYNSTTREMHFIDSEVIDEIMKESNPELVSKSPFLTKDWGKYEDTRNGEIYYIANKAIDKILEEGGDDDLL